MSARVLLPVILLAAACGDDGGGPAGPYDGLPVDQRVDVDGLDGPVDVIRDAYGVPHVHASSIGDLAFAQGYVMANDRIQQMDLFRHFAAGRISQLFGALAPEQIDADLEMRIHRFEATAQATWAALEASAAPADQELVLYLVRFSDGVNRYLDDLRAGVRELDPAVAAFFDPQRTRAWTPADSLVIGRLQAMELSYSDAELDETEMRDLGAAGFTGARAGAFFDLVRFAPADPTTTRDGWPGVSSGAAPRAAGAAPVVPRDLLRRIRRERTGLAARFFDPRNGSNNWVVGPPLTGGATLLANDPHLTLSSPSIFYPMHLTVPGDVDVAGITFPGIPGIILGHNQHVAWGATTVNHDVTDFYLEEVVPCAAGGGDCTVWNGAEVPIETWEETLEIGAFGTITETRTVTFERVPHHGPILPTIVDHDVAPRPPGPAIAVRYTGHEQTHELAAFQGLWRATTVAEAHAAMEAFGFGAQNWVFADDQGSIGWSTHALVPWRTAGCFTFDPATGDGVGPWWVVPGDGSCEWDGWIPAEHLPQDRDPARGFIATANADPVGETLDGDPGDGPLVDGKRLYVGARDYDEGYRVGRITRRLEAIAPGAATAEDMMSIQGDTYSNLGAALTPALLAAIAALDEELAAPGTHPDLATFAAGLGDAARARIDEARALLAAWSFETPAASSPASAATVIFNAWAVEVTDTLLGDEAAVLGRGPGTWLTSALVATLTAPATLRTGVAAETGEPLLCDRVGTAEIESCTLGVLVALDAALAWGVGELGADLGSWTWGELHTLALEPLIPQDDLRVPRDGAGYPRPGDNHAVDASSPGLSDHDYRYDHGPAMRHVTVLGDGAPRTFLALPGGTIMDTRSPHWSDLMDTFWSVNEYFELPWTVAQITERAEERWRFD